LADGSVREKKRLAGEMEETMRWLVLMAAVCGCGGCGSLQYQGWSPSFRWAREEPDLQDVYYGAEMKFTVAEPAPYHSGNFSSAQARASDAWNTPVAFQPLTTPAAMARPVEHATVSPEPAIVGDDANK
jgi:hypothetical protein